MRLLQLNVGPTSQTHILLKSIEGPKISSKASRIEQKVALDQTRYSRANCAVRISIQVCSPRILTKFNYWLVLKAKIQNAVQIHTKGLGTRTDYASILI